MTVYSQRADDGKYYSSEGELMPSFKEVGATRLKIGSIIFLTCRGTYVSASVTLIERVHGRPGAAPWWHVTAVTQSGGVEIIKAWAGGKDFKLQCDAEELLAKAERERNIVLRRKITALKNQVLDVHYDIRSMTRPPEAGHYRRDEGVIANPKVVTYVQRLKDFADELQAMFNEVGRDFGLSQVKNKEEKEEKIDLEG